MRIITFNSLHPRDQSVINLAYPSSCRYHNLKIRHMSKISTPEICL